MKQRAPLILGIAACVLSALCLWQVAALHAKLAQLEASQDSAFSSLEATLQSIPSQIDSTLTVQNSLLADYDWQCGQADLETWTAPFTFTATPKEQTPGVTTAALAWDGKNYPMETREDGSFSATLELPLLQEITLAKIIFSEGGRQQAEALDISVIPGEESLPLLYGALYYTASYQNGSLQLHGLDITAELTSGSSSLWTGLSLVVKADGKELGRQPLTPPDEEWTEWTSFSQALEDVSYPAAQGQTIALSLEAADAQGLRYVAPLVELTLSKSGIFPAGSNQFTSDTIEIYSPQGKLLWSGSPYLY